MYGVKKTTLSSPKIQTLSVPKPAHFAKAEDQGGESTSPGVWGYRAPYGANEF